MANGISIHADPRDWGHRIAFLIGRENNGPREVASLVWRESSLAKVEPETFSLDMQVAQSLMDQLWACGVRPTEGRGSAGALAATQQHLEDMRRLVFEPREERVVQQEGGNR